MTDSIMFNLSTYMYCACSYFFFFRLFLPPFFFVTPSSPSAKSSSTLLFLSLLDPTLPSAPNSLRIATTSSSPRAPAMARGAIRLVCPVPQDPIVRTSSVSARGSAPRSNKALTSRSPDSLSCPPAFLALYAALTARASALSDLSRTSRTSRTSAPGYPVSDERLVQRQWCTQLGSTGKPGESRTRSASKSDPSMMACSNMQFFSDVNGLSIVGL
mmetsp:Transcript_1815/g.3998  ORF Transcript_1815/g.3998 Transcript_1815/m.3998 type:complete len:215 (-) Transcript_1815:66-710(-)